MLNSQLTLFLGKEQVSESWPTGTRNVLLGTGASPLQEMGASDNCLSANAYIPFFLSGLTISHIPGKTS